MKWLEIKKDPKLLAFAAFLVAVCASLVVHGDITWKEAAAFIGAALGLPGLLGHTKDESVDVEVK